MIAPEDQRAIDSVTRAERIKGETRARIYAVADPNKQASLLAAVLTGRLGEVDLATFARGQEWIEHTKAAGRKAIASGNDPAWPTVPPGVEELATRF